MPPLLSCRDLAKAYSAHPLFEGLSLDVNEAERVGLIGPNGAGKSTLLRIMAGREEADAGVRSAAKGMRLGYLAQADEFVTSQTVVAAIAAALVKLGLDAHEAEAESAIALSKAGFADLEQAVSSLSGGWRKRLAIVREFALTPDLLLMDEPTNHLDLDGVMWLERLLSNATFACVVASHDRYFLERVATRIVEVDPRHDGGCFSSIGGYNEFLVHRQQNLEIQQSRQETLSNRVRREEEWLKKAPKARTTKSEGRIKEAGRLIDELKEVSWRNSQTRTVDIDFDASGRRTNDLVVAKGISKTLGGKKLFDGLDLALGPGTRLGLLGRNGSGKSTLLRAIAGEIQPDAGTIKRALELRTVVFHQDRTRLDPKRTLRKTLCPNGETVLYRNHPIHLMSWAKRFLFKHEQLDLEVGTLSGGEQARILISLLMLQSADLLLLDEPTNDLDIPSLEVLEESLIEFPGAVVLVTHDRFMLSRVSTNLLALDGAGGVHPFADYSQWQQAQERLVLGTEKITNRSGGAARAGSQRKPAAAGLSPKENRELERMEESIATAEAEIEKAEQAIANPTVSSDPVELERACTRLAESQAEVDRLYSRWHELEEKRKAAAG